MIVMKQVAAMSLAEKRLVFKNCTGATVNEILPDDEVNEAFNEIDGNFTGVDWKAEVQDPMAHMPQLNNNQYAALAGEEDNKDNDTEST